MRQVGAQRVDAVHGVALEGVAQAVDRFGARLGRVAAQAARAGEGLEVAVVGPVAEGALQHALPAHGIAPHVRPDHVERRADRQGGRQGVIDLVAVPRAQDVQVEHAAGIEVLLQAGQAQAHGLVAELAQEGRAAGGGGQVGVAAPLAAGGAVQVIDEQFDHRQEVQLGAVIAGMQVGQGRGGGGHVGQGSLVGDGGGELDAQGDGAAGAGRQVAQVAQHGRAGGGEGAACVIHPQQLNAGRQGVGEQSAQGSYVALVADCQAEVVAGADQGRVPAHALPGHGQVGLGGGDGQVGQVEADRRVERGGGLQAGGNRVAAHDGVGRGAGTGHAAAVYGHGQRGPGAGGAGQCGAGAGGRRGEDHLQPIQRLAGLVGAHLRHQRVGKGGAHDGGLVVAAHQAEAVTLGLVGAAVAAPAGRVRARQAALVKRGHRGRQAGRIQGGVDGG